ncbi:MAG: alpha/beta hydrolase [Sneathiella sp.]|jgi:pimeloyl-ACP methyl ester carboxylesterase|uniref:alpha/beta fold hydrolase n=1 Tax=Sneathiella sp. TaxID=1964365 RepID=UPI000C63315A|nr:alpha/beta hydrolase [Sneathiella sp.]MAL80119.1 alpha/beta hydrolase [Sneathiella sp.]
MTFSEHFYTSPDGLNLYYREYGTEEEACPLVCLSGLTRNSGDFHDFALRYSKTRKVYALDYRGRGKSDYDASYSNYNPQVYLGDIYAFLTQKNISRALFVGTSLGGLLIMALAGLAKQFIAGAILNDVGPEVDQSGGNRILEYVGKDVRFPTPEACASQHRESYIGAYPDLDAAGWQKVAGNTYTFDETARNYRLNYDLALGKALAEQFGKGEQVDLWPFFRALDDIPLLAIRGALSDVLSAEVFARMQQENPKMQAVLLENRGHVPLLDEPAALEKMDPFIAGIR